MERYLRLVFLLVLLLLGKTLVWAQNPVITSPTNGATVPTSGFNVVVAPNSYANSTYIQVTNTVTGALYAISGPRYGTGEITYAVPPGLAPSTNYRIDAIAYTNFGVRVSPITVTTSNTLSPSPAPVITSPTNGSTVPTSGFNIVVAANPYANSTYIVITNLATGVQYANSGFRGGTGEITFAVPPGLSPNTNYRIQATSFTNYGHYNTVITVISSSTPSPTPAPVFTSPTNGSTVPTNGFNIVVAANPYANYTNIYVTDLSTNTTYASSPRTYGTGEITYAVPPALTPSTNYRILAVSNTVYGNYSSAIVVTSSSTPSPSPTPVITSPANGSTVPTSGFNVVVAPNPYANSTYITVKNAATGVVYASSGPRYGTGEITFAVAPGLTPSTSYRIEALAYTNYGVKLSSIIVTSSNTPAPSPAPVITSPMNGSQVSTSGFDVVVAPNPYANNTYISIINLATGAQYANSGFRSGTGEIIYTVPGGLTPNTNYRIQASAFTNYGQYNSSIIVTAVITDLQTTKLIAIDGQSVDTNPYANNRVYTLTAQASPNANQYNWQFDIEGDFTTPEYSTSSPSNVLSLDATTGGLISGQRYFVRVQAFNTSLNVSSIYGTIKTFYNALHPIWLLSPVGDMNRTSFKIKTQDVANATDFIFQLAEADGDADPSNDFEEFKIVKQYNGSVVSFPTVVGNVFKANAVQVNSNGSIERVVNYVILKAWRTYRVRVRAAKANSTGTYVQTGYWSQIVTLTTNNVPARAHSISDIEHKPVTSNTMTDISLGNFPIVISQDLNWNITSYDLQISTTPDFSNLVVDARNIGRAYFLSGLQPGHTYYARGRSYIDNDPNTASNWNVWPGVGVLRFVTKASTARVGETAKAGTDENQSSITLAFPNPFIEITQLTIPPSYEKVTISVSNALGVLIEEIQANGGETVKLGEKWGTGVYILQIKEGSHTYKIIRVVKQ